MMERLFFDCTKDRDAYGTLLSCCSKDCKRDYESHCQHCTRYKPTANFLDGGIVQ